MTPRAKPNALPARPPWETQLQHPDREQNAFEATLPDPTQPNQTQPSPGRVANAKSVLTSTSSKAEVAEGAQPSHRVRGAASPARPRAGHSGYHAGGEHAPPLQLLHRLLHLREGLDVLRVRHPPHELRKLATQSRVRLVDVVVGGTGGARAVRQKNVSWCKCGWLDVGEKW